VSAFEEPRSLNGRQRDILDETLKRMAKAPHAGVNFHEAIMEQAAQLPVPRTSWWRRLSDTDTWVLLRPPRLIAAVGVGVLVCCMVGVSVTYQQLTARRVENRDQQSRVVVAKRPDTAKPSTSATGEPLPLFTQAERDALSRATLDVKPLEAGEGLDELDRPSLAEWFLRGVQRTEAMVWGWWEKLREVWAPPSPTPAPTDENAKS
jgi:hypothetical protein